MGKHNPNVNLAPFASQRGSVIDQLVAKGLNNKKLQHLDYPTLIEMLKLLNQKEKEYKLQQLILGAMKDSEKEDRYREMFAIHPE